MWGSSFPVTQGSFTLAHLHACKVPNPKNQREPVVVHNQVAPGVSSDVVNIAIWFVDLPLKNDDFPVHNGSVPKATPFN